MNYLLFHIEKIINMLNTYSLSSFLIFQPDLEILVPTYVFKAGFIYPKHESGLCVKGRIPIPPARMWGMCLRQDSYTPSTKVAYVFKAGFLYPQHESGLCV